MSCDWRDSEPPIAETARQLWRLLRRGLARAPLACALAAALTVAAISIWTRPRAVTAHALLRVSESALSEGRPLLSPADLAAYVDDVAFVEANLVALAARHRLYPRAPGPTEAAEALRSDLSIEVFHNYFALARGEVYGLRTARVRIGFRHPDAAVAAQVASQLAALVVAVDTQRRHERIERNLREAGALQAATAAAIDQSERALLQRMADARAGGAADGLLGPRIARGSAASSSDWALLRSADRARSEALLQSNGEHLAFDVKFEVAEVRGPRPTAWTRLQLVPLALGLFALCLPMSLVALGAFDWSVRDREDLARRGLDLIGRLPEDRRTR